MKSTLVNTKGTTDTKVNQSAMASINHPSVSRSRKIRYTAPSLSATSHSSRSHGGRKGWRAPPAHHSPDVRHGPARVSTWPPSNPRRSVVTHTGSPSTTATRAGTGCRQRRRACGTRMSALGLLESTPLTFPNSRGAPPPRAGTASAPRLVLAGMRNSVLPPPPFPEAPCRFRGKSCSNIA